MRLNRLIAAMLLAGMAMTAADAGAAEGELPLPRFVSLKSDEVNLRTGPGVRYPIKWVYQRRDLPVEVVEEFEHWRKIRDYMGESGWVHYSMLSGKRTVIVTAPLATFHHRMDEESPAIFRTTAGVTGELLECVNHWCRVQVEGLKGWTDISVLWGVLHDQEASGGAL